MHVFACFISRRQEAVKLSLTASLVAKALSIYFDFIVQQLVKRDLEQYGDFAQHGDVGCFFAARQFPNVALLNAKMLPQLRL